MKKEKKKKNDSSACTIFQVVKKSHLKTVRLRDPIVSYNVQRIAGKQKQAQTLTAMH